MFFLLSGLFAAESKSPAVQQILTLLHEQNLAANAHDTDRFLATYLHDDSLIFVSNGQLIQDFNSLHFAKACFEGCWPS